MNTTTLNLSDIKPLIIRGKSWFDRVNGNSYCSARVTINFGMPDEQTFSVPFQYGYGSYYEQASFEEIERITNLTSWELRDHARNIPTDSRIQKDCLKRDVIAWGK